MTGSARTVIFGLLAVICAVPVLIITMMIDEDSARCAPSGAVLGQGLPTVDGVTLAGLDTTQLQIAKLVVVVGEQRHVSSTGILAALMAGAQESRFRNYANSNVPESLSYPHDAVAADHDSVGPWQMRVSIWTTDTVGIAELMNPEYQANWFYDRLTAIDGWETRDPADLAQAVEVSAYPHAYAQHRDLASALYTEFKGSGGALVSSYADHCLPVNGVPGQDLEPSEFGARVLAAAERWLGTQYVWGGGDINGPTSGGFDCSGLTLYAIHQASGGTLTLPHYTQAQQDHPAGRVITSDQMALGDLVFFTAPGDSDSHHVGIYAGGGQLLHAPQTGDVVKYTPLSAWDGERWDIRRYNPEDSGAPDA